VGTWLKHCSHRGESLVAEPRLHWSEPRGTFPGGPGASSSCRSSCQSPALQSHVDRDTSVPEPSRAVDAWAQPEAVLGTGACGLLQMKGVQSDIFQSNQQAQRGIENRFLC